MTFEDLPQDWDDNPITHDMLPDVVDLFVKSSDRFEGCLTLLLLTEDHRLMQPVAIEHFDPAQNPDEAEAFLTSMCELACDFGGTYVVARGRTGPAVATPDDHAWFEPVTRSLGNHLLAAFVATERDVVPLELDAVS